MLKLSIILPMYNVAPYVGRCIRSLEDQDIPQEDYEIICVNDGSPDNCRGLVEELQQEFNNVVLINQENQGVSMARNNGIDRAKGEYLLFIDPDDYVDANSFTRIIQNADKRQAQISFLGFAFLNEDGSTRQTVINEKESNKVYSGMEAYFLSRGDGRTDPDRMWAVLFERNFINRHQLYYLPGVPYLEDGELIARIMCLAERCIFDGHSFYQRTTRPGSATNSNLFHSEKAAKGFLKAAANLASFKNTRCSTSQQKDFMNQPIIKFTTLYLTSLGPCAFIAKYKKITRQLKTSFLYPLETNGVIPFYSRMANYYNFNVLAYYLYWFSHKFKLSFFEK